MRLRIPRPVYKPHSVRQRPVKDRMLSRRSSILAGRLRPARAAYPGLNEASSLGGLAPNRPCLALLPMGVAWPPLLPETPVVSYTAFSPLLAYNQRYVSVARSGR